MKLMLIEVSKELRLEKYVRNRIEVERDALTQKYHELQTRSPCDKGTQTIESYEKMSTDMITNILK